MTEREIQLLALYKAIADMEASEEEHHNVVTAASEDDYILPKYASRPRKRTGNPDGTK